MFEKMTDGDVMVYLRNTMLALRKLSQERQVLIDIYISKGGTVKARAEDYTVTIYKDGHEEYAYEPIRKGGSVSDWKSYIPPQSIRFGQAPKEES